MAYRKDIDGLRALAVLPVVLFHAGFEVFSGGFVGVDVFFVISGYLITLIIAQEIGEGRFSILRFYERRIRRIFPALFAVLLFVTIGGLLIFLPEDMKALSGSVAAATLFASNILFWQQSGYFETAAEMKPLLHTWSLAVEEQFYIFFPLFLMLAWRWGRRWRSATWLALIASFVISVYGVRYHDEAAFYLLPARAWELLIGSVIALKAVPRIDSRMAREAMAALGIALIVYAVFAFDRATPFPGENALLPCLGAALIIYTGLGNGETWAARLLGLKPVVFIGLISYSLYLWHWPLIVFARYYAIFPLSQMEAAAVVLTSLIVATLSWRYIETPFRKGNGTFFTRNRARLFASSGVIMASAIAISLATIILHGLPMRMMDRSAGTIISEAEVGVELIRHCMNSRKDPSYRKPESACVFGSASRQSDVVLWGDSHAGALLPALLKAMPDKNHGVRMLAMLGCPPLLDVNLRSTKLDACREFNRDTVEYLKSGPEQTIVVVGRWAATLHGRVPGPEGATSPPVITRIPGLKLSVDDATELLKESLKKTIDALLKSGKKVFLVYPAPEAGFNVSHVLALSSGRYGKESIDGLSISKLAFLDRSGDILHIFDALPAAKNLHRIRPSDLLCGDKVCLVYKDGKSLYYDDDHLSQAGAEYLSPLFAPVFADAN